MTDEADVYICGICKKEFQDFVTFLQHKSNFGVFKCKLCNLSYHDREDIQKHINTNHANQKVDVAFTIPTKQNIVSTKAEIATTVETSKPGYALSVFTCRLCNRFTLIEKVMLQHLQMVHKIHVIPGSVELAALMLCSKPLDSASIPKLTGNPVVVKSVTPPPSTQKSNRVIGVTAATQTTLTTSDIAALACLQEQSDECISFDDKNSAVDFFGNWLQLSEGDIEASLMKEKETPLLEEKNVGSVSEKELALPSEVTATVSSSEDKQIKMASILKPTVTYSKTRNLGAVISSEIGSVARESKTDVCVDGEHDYASSKEPNMLKEQIVEEEVKSMEEPTIVLCSEDIITEFSDAFESPAQGDASICLVEQVVPQENAAVIVTSEPEKLNIIKTAPRTYGKKTAKVMNVSLPDKKLVTTKNKESSPLLAKSNKLRLPVSTKIESQNDESDDEDNFNEDVEEAEETAEEAEAVNDDPQPGPDGMYHCRDCKRAFARERQFKAHMNIHVMYGEHYLESPSSNRIIFGEGKVPQRKRQKTH